MARGSKPVGILDADGKVRRWTAVVDVAPDPATGKRRQKRLSARTKKALEGKIADTLGEVRRGDYLEPSDLTLADYLPQWLAAHAATVGDASVNQYASIVRARLLPGLGAVRLRRLTPLAIQAHEQALRDAGYAPASVQAAHVLLHAALAQAVKWGLLARNPADGVAGTAPAPKPARVWTAAQVAAFLDATALDPAGPLWRLMLDTGCRLGEALALRWVDLDLAAGSATISRTLTKTRGGQWVVGEHAKTGASRRTVALLPETVAALLEHRDRQAFARRQAGAAWRDEDLVFPGPDGQRLRPDRAREWLAAAVAAAGLPRLTPHGLRHTHATLLLAAGVHPRIVQDRLGHRSIQTTLDRYSHPSITMQRDAVAALDALLKTARDQSVTGEDAAKA